VKPEKHPNQQNHIRKNYVKRAKLRRLATEKAARKRKKLMKVNLPLFVARTCGDGHA